MEYYKHFKTDLFQIKTGILINDNGTYYVEQNEIINNRGLHHDIVYIKNKEEKEQIQL